MRGRGARSSSRTSARPSSRSSVPAPATTREPGAPLLGDPEGRDTTEAAHCLACNRGKRSAAIDFTTPDGRRGVHGLAKVGLDYASPAAACPRLACCSITGLVQTGPYADRAGDDVIVQHTRDVLRERPGSDDAEIARLVAADVIGVRG